MLFKSRSAINEKKEQEDKLSEQLKSKRKEIKQRLQQLSTINEKLQQTVIETQELAVQVRDKVKRMLKVDERSLAAICRDMHEGIVLVSNSGRIVHVNKAAEKIFNTTETSIVNSSIANIVADMEMVDQRSGDELTLSSSFFSRLSRVIFDHLNLHKCTINCPELHTIEHKFINVVNGETVNVAVTCDGRRFGISFNCTVLDNNPEEVRDVTFVFVIKPTKFKIK